MEKIELIVGIKSSRCTGAGVFSIIQNTVIIMLAMIVIGELIINGKLSWILITLIIIIFLGKKNLEYSGKVEDIHALLSNQIGYVSLLLKNCEKRAGETVNKEICIDKGQEFSAQTIEEGQVRLNYSGKNIITDSSGNVVQTRSVTRGYVDLYMDKETWEEMDHFFQNIER